MTVKAKADAIDRFVRTLKSGGGLWDDINAACIMAGWTNLAGALYPFKGAAPTNNGFLAADLDAGIGLKGDGSSKYLDSNRANNADGQDDNHNSVFVSASGSPAVGEIYIAAGSASGQENGSNNLGVTDAVFCRNRSASPVTELGSASSTGVVAVSRSSASGISTRTGSTTITSLLASQSPLAEEVTVFARRSGATVGFYSNATLSWYSIGTATDLAALDSAVSTLMADLRAIDEDGFDRDALAYIRAVEAADGAYLETGVKQAINRFIVGCKKDGIWDALKASCILCGARTIAGALVPLAGTAPTAYNFTSAQYNRETGLVGVPASSTYIDTNRANNADGQDDNHNSVYVTTPAVGALLASSSSLDGQNYLDIISTPATRLFSRSNTLYEQQVGAASAGLYSMSRGNGSSFDFLTPQGSGTKVAASETTDTRNVLLYARSNDGVSFSAFSSARIAFYSIGSSLSLSALNARVTTLVSQIAAAIP